jgi:hypothetical protein
MHPSLEVRLMRHYIDHLNPPQHKRIKHGFAWTAGICFLALAAAFSALAAI